MILIESTTGSGYAALLKAAEKIPDRHVGRANTEALAALRQQDRISDDAS